MRNTYPYCEAWHMKHILIATDFSERSDRAIRRGTLLAKRLGAKVTLLHAIDDDQPKRIVQAERKAAGALLNDQARSLQDIDGLACDVRIALGAAFEGITKSVEDIATDLLVMGPHRRQALKDIFVGTTAERTIRASRRPVLMANAVPAKFYSHALVATDLSACSGDAVRSLLALGLQKMMSVSVVHVFDGPGARHLARAGMTEAQIGDYVADEASRATDELGAFLREVNLSPLRRLVKLDQTSIANAIYAAAEEVDADLIVVGTHGRSGITKRLLGSVAEEVLLRDSHDVLVVPPSEKTSG